MKTQVYNLEGKPVSEMELPDGIFAREWNPDLVHQIVLAQKANARIPWAHAKGRGEVRGGGKKPWKQKHTGRARHGSIRSPIWKGGGVAHGPTSERSYEQKVNKKMMRAALSVALSKRLKDGELKIVENLPKDLKKTKDFAKAVSVIVPKMHALFVPDSANKLIFRASANIKDAKTLAPGSLNVYDLLRYRNIIMDSKAVGEIAGRK